MPPILYAIVCAAVVGSILGTLIERWFVAVLAANLAVILPTGLLVLTRTQIVQNVLLAPDLRVAVADLTDPGSLFQMIVACVGGALLAGALARTAKPRTPSAAPRGVRAAKARVAAVTERVDALAAPTPRSFAVPVYKVAPSLSGPVRASSVGDRPAASAAADDNRRSRGRRRAILAGLLMMDDGRSCPCRIVDVSDTGARIRLPTLMPLPEKLWLLNTSDWLGYEVELAWRANMEAGLRFLSKRNLREPATDQDRAMQALCVGMSAR